MIIIIACFICFCLGFLVAAMLGSGKVADLHSEIWFLKEENIKLWFRNRDSWDERKIN